MQRDNSGWAWGAAAALCIAACGSPEADSAHGTSSGQAGRSSGVATPPRAGSGGSAAVSGSAGSGSGQLFVPPTAAGQLPPSNTTPSGGAIPPAANGGGTTPPGGVTPPAGGAIPPGGTTPPASNGGGVANNTPPPAPGTWPAADPSKTGPFQVTTEMNVGPMNSYTMVRPAMLTTRHPVITWGNGTGTTPSVYQSLLNLYASHGFIVIASNSMNVAQGDPPPMLDGVTWVLAQDEMAGTTLYQHVDRDHIGATGHSQGAFAASSCGTDPRIKTVAPIETLGARNGFHGPMLGLCGSMDTTVPCSGNMRSFMTVTDQPIMYAEFKAADHTNWIFSPGMPHPYWVITTAWFRLQLMGDTSLRNMFYGPDCTYCKDDQWIVMRKMMDN